MKKQQQQQQCLMDRLRRFAPRYLASNRNNSLLKFSPASQTLYQPVFWENLPCHKTTKLSHETPRR